MKSILGISIAIHAAAISVALEIVAHRDIICVSASEHSVVEMQLGLATKLSRNIKETSSARHETAQTASRLQAEMTPPQIEQLASTVTAPAMLEALPEADKSGNESLSWPSAANYSGHTNNLGTAAAGDSGKVDGAAITDALPWVIYGPAPEYPREARRKGWTGHVRVHVLISEQGTVQQVQLASSSGHIELDEAGMRALQKWRFHPAQKNGHAIAAWVFIPVLFRLDD